MPGLLNSNMRATLISASLVQKAVGLTSHGQSPSGVRLPPLPFRMGGAHFREDSDFVRAGVGDVKRLAEVTGLSRSSRLLDWGCGAGRLAVGVKEYFGNIDLYHGVDVNKEFIAWNRRNLGGEHFRFSQVNTFNERYNRHGYPWSKMPSETGSIDVFYAYSVFSHLRTPDTLRYLMEIERVLQSDGWAFITAFVEDEVPDEAENPVGYGSLKWSGPLHCIRYNRKFFDGMVTQADLTITKFEHGKETDGQSLYLLRKTIQGPGRAGVLH